MDVAFVQNCENHVHYKDGERHQDRQTGNGPAKREGFALQLCTNARWDYLSRRLIDEIGRRAKSNPRLQVEGERHTRELIEVVH